MGGTHHSYCGRRFTEAELAMVVALVKGRSDLSFTGLAREICRKLDWYTPRGDCKRHTCATFLRALERKGLVTLPTLRKARRPAKPKPPPLTHLGDPGSPVNEPLADIIPVRAALATAPDAIAECNELLYRYHYIGYAKPFCRHLRYMFYDKNNRRLGCLIIGGATSKLPCRDQWLGWSDEARLAGLERVVCNTRFLIFPWVNVKCLASKLLAMTLRRLAADWEAHFGYRPLLVETFIDPKRFEGICYRASNWRYIGKSGKKKDVYIYPLVGQSRLRLTLTINQEKGEWYRYDQRLNLD